MTSSAVRRFVCVSFTLALLACAPTYNWREIRATGWSALFPGKPASGTRTLPLLGSAIRLTLYSVDVDDKVFAVGSAELPPELIATPARLHEVEQSFERALLANIGGQPEKISETVPDPWTRGGRAAPEVAREVEAKGAWQGKPRRVHARFYIARNRIYEVIVATELNAASREAVDTFFDGFKPD